MMSRIFHHVMSADLLTPVAAYMRLGSIFAGTPSFPTNRLLFESVEGGKARGRYSVIAMYPDLLWRYSKGVVDVNKMPFNPDGDYEPLGQKAIPALRRLVADAKIPIADFLPPMIGGVFGYLGYGFVGEIESIPDSGLDDLNIPDGLLIRPAVFAVFDSLRDEVVIATISRPGGLSENDAEQMLQTVKDGLGLAQNDIADQLDRPPVIPLRPVPSVSDRDFEAVVRQAKEHIAAGNAFQIVPSRRFDVEFPLSALTLYRSLRRVNPAPFLFLLEFPGFSLVGSSPEILVRLRDNDVTIRPLAGTRPRGETAADDLALERDLLSDEKERAEHLMLIDLGRNDVGRVAELGSVSVPEKFIVERYSHVMHISSTVKGKIRLGFDAIDALCAAFPAGTLTGAPKISAMEIIDTLEPTRRGPYAGCLGYFGADGQMDTCIALRMAILKDGKMHVQAGCGVVSDSSPSLEEQETRHKSRALFIAAEKALEDAWQRNPSARLTARGESTIS